MEEEEDEVEQEGEAEGEGEKKGEEEVDEEAGKEGGEEEEEEKAGGGGEDGEEGEEKEQDGDKREDNGRKRSGGLHGKRRRMYEARESKAREEGEEFLQNQRRVLVVQASFVAFVVAFIHHVANNLTAVTIFVNRREQAL